MMHAALARSGLDASVIQSNRVTGHVRAWRREHNGVTPVWYYGHWFHSSSLIVKVPEDRLTFVVLANSDGLSRWRSLGDHADVLRSPAARMFLDAFVTAGPVNALP
jgi:CubicO group peptidase (beta-lactamase class C family)